MQALLLTEHLVSAAYTSGAMSFSCFRFIYCRQITLCLLAVTYALSDSISLTADTDSTAGAAAVNSVSVSTALNGVSITAATDSASTWDLDLGYSVSGIALTYGTDENDAWDASATYALGGGATVKAGVNAEELCLCWRSTRILIQAGFDDFKGHHLWCPFFISKGFYDITRN